MKHSLRPNAIKPSIENETMHNGKQYKPTDRHNTLYTKHKAENILSKYIRRKK